MRSMFRRVQRRAARVAIGSAMVTAALASVGVNAQPASALGGGGYSVAVTPTSVAAGATGQGFTLSVTNQSPQSSDLLQSFTITLPTSGFTVTGVSGASDTSNGLIMWSASSNGNTVNLNSAVGSPPGDVIVATITANVTSVSGNPGAWPTSGAGTIGSVVGQPYTLSGSNPDVIVTPTAVTHLTSDATIADSVINTNLNPAPTFSARDQFGNVVTGYSGSATLNVKFNQTGATNPANTPQTVAFSNGVAKFPAVKFNQPGQYSLEAASGSFTADTNAFNVGDTVNNSTVCSPNTPCSASDNTGSTHGALTVQLSGGSGSGDVLTVSNSPLVHMPYNMCGASVLSGSPDPAEYDNHDSSRSMTATQFVYQQNKTEDEKAEQALAASTGVCYEEPNAFTQANGTTTTQTDPANGMYVGLLPKCANVGNVVPCLASVSMVSTPRNLEVGNNNMVDSLQVVVNSVSGDPIQVPVLPVAV